MVTAFFLAGFLGMTRIRDSLGAGEEQTDAVPESSRPEPPAVQTTAVPPDTVPETPPVTEPPAEPNANARDFSGLEAQLNGDLEGLLSSWAVYMLDLETGGQAEAYHSAPDGPAAIDGDTPMTAASLIKLWIMAAVYDKAQSENAGAMPDENTYLDIQSMITASSNDAANRLVTDYLGGGDREAGMEAVNSYARGIGCDNTRMNRLMLEEGEENLTTVRDCAVILEMIVKRQCVNAAASGQMEDFLFHQTFCNKIPAGVAETEGVKVGNKTGELTGRAQNDAAIVRTPQGSYLLCVMCMDPVNDQSAIKTIVDISRAVCESYMNAG